MRLLLVLAGALTLSACAYWWLERLGPRAWLPFVFRSVAWASLGVLALNLSCPVSRSGSGQPLVLLDASLSMAGAGGRWGEAVD